MFIVGDKVRLRTTSAIGKVKELVGDREICVEFDECAGTQTCFGIEKLELLRPMEDPSANVEMIQADKGL